MRFLPKNEPCAKGNQNNTIPEFRGVPCIHPRFSKKAKPKIYICMH